MSGSRNRPQPTEAQIRAEYERLCADLKSTFTGIQAEYFAPPSFEEFKQAHQGDNHA